MRFIVDECTGPKVAQWLRDSHHDVFSVYEEARGMIDDDILKKANLEDWILITNDKDFGEKIYRERHPHKGVILLRLTNDRAFNKINALQSLIQNYAIQLKDNYSVVSDSKVRIITQ